ncbi:MAG: glutathione peroxidase [Pelagibacteraceae bacterium]
MKKIVVILVFMFGLFNMAKANYLKLAHEFEFNSIQGDIIKLSDYKDKVIVIVNVASRCGYTPQYENLQTLWSDYRSKGVVIIGVPTNNFKQEPGSNKEIKDFCETNFGIDFPMTQKIDVIGNKAHPFYKWAKENHGIAAIPKWNFHKIIISKNGKVADTFASFTKPTSKKFIKIIEREIKN